MPQTDTQTSYMHTYFAKGFLIALLAAVVFICYLVFEPFLLWLLVAAVLTTIFYPWYKFFLQLFRGYKTIASLVMCLIVALMVLIPISVIIIYAADRIIEIFPSVMAYFSQDNVDKLLDGPYVQKLENMGVDIWVAKDYLIDVATSVANWVLSGARAVAGQVANFLISIPVIIFTMFFFFMDGERMLKRLMHWTPLPNKYDQEIFEQFRDVSFQTVISTFITAIAQGLIGAVGFLIIGVPAFFAAVAMGFLSLLPYVGTGFIWAPVAAYLLITGQIWQGIFLAVWGAGVISLSDNLIRAYIIRGKAHVHPIFIIFSILGGIALFGFWGIIFGPLAVALAVTILHIYEMEYQEELEG
jgi:predicted PurR-regulated permease PerM